MWWASMIPLPVHKVCLCIVCWCIRTVSARRHVCTHACVHAYCQHFGFSGLLTHSVAWERERERGGGGLRAGTRTSQHPPTTPSSICSPPRHFVFARMIGPALAVRKVLLRKRSLGCGLCPPVYEYALYISVMMCIFIHVIEDMYEYAHHNRYVKAILLGRYSRWMRTEHRAQRCLRLAAPPPQHQHLAYPLHACPSQGDCRYSYTHTHTHTHT